MNTAANFVKVFGVTDMKLYRLFTQNVNKQWICELVSQYFNGFTVFEATGYWKGCQEQSLCIEIMTDSYDISAPSKINALSQAICLGNEQESVLIQELDVKHESITV